MSISTYMSELEITSSLIVIYIIKPKMVSILFDSSKEIPFMFMITQSCGRSGSCNVSTDSGGGSISSNSSNRSSSIVVVIVVEVVDV